MTTVNLSFSDIQDQGDGTYTWLNSKPPYSCSIASPKKESKLKGLKSYIAYQLTPSVSLKIVIFILVVRLRIQPQFYSGTRRIFKCPLFF